MRGSAKKLRVKPGVLRIVMGSMLISMERCCNVWKKVRNAYRKIPEYSTKNNVMK